MDKIKKRYLAMFVLLGIGAGLHAQQTGPLTPQAQSQTTQIPAQTTTQTPAQPDAQAVQAGVASLRPDYTLGPNDQVIVHAAGVEELNDRPFRVDDDGTVLLPLVGLIRVAGRTVQQFEEELRTKLKTYVVNPQVSVTLVQFRSDPVFFVGAFQKPGVLMLQGRRTLIEMLAAVGGLQPTASRRIKVTRKQELGPIPLGSAVEDPENKTSSVEISLGALTQSINPAEDIVLQPYDVVSVETAEQVYAQGELEHVGSFSLGERDSLSVLQLVSMAGGLTRDADAEHVFILRPVMNTTRRAEIHLNLKEVMAARNNDYPLQQNDILYVPRVKQHQILSKVALIAVPVIPTIILLLITRL